MLWDDANASSLIFNLKNVSCLQTLITDTIYFSTSTTKVHVCRHVNFIEDKFPARAFSGQSEHVIHIPTSSSKVGTRSRRIPDQAREPDSDNIPTITDDSKSKNSVSDEDCENHDIIDLEDDHEGADDSHFEEVIDSESSDSLPEIDIGVEVSGSDGLQFSSEYPSFSLLSSSRTRIVAIPKPLG
jgi:hypothetical protein